MPPPPPSTPGLGSISSECLLPPPSRSLPGVTLLFCHEYAYLSPSDSGWLVKATSSRGWDWGYHIPQEGCKLSLLICYFLQLTTLVRMPRPVLTLPSIACSSIGPVCLALDGAWHTTAVSTRARLSSSRHYILNVCLYHPPVHPHPRSAGSSLAVPVSLQNRKLWTRWRKDTWMRLFAERGR